MPADTVETAPFIDTGRDFETNILHLGAFVITALAAALICFARSGEWIWLAAYAALIAVPLVPARRLLPEMQRSAREDC
ncbi:MAG: hypothetical protein AAFR11_14820 [Pseudomonadota bacterium]